MYGQMTAGSWIYIGTQGILQGTYETFAECARQHFGGTLGRPAGGHRRPGRHGRRAAAGRDDERRRRSSASTSIAARIERRVETGYCDRLEHDLDEALRAGSTTPGASGAPLSVGLVGNVAEVLPELVRARRRARRASPIRPSAHDLRVGYIPAGLSLDDAARAARARSRAATSSAVLDSMVVHVEAMLALQAPRRGRLRLRQQPARARWPTTAAWREAFDIPGFVPAFIRPLFCRGAGPFRWAALSGDPGRHRRHRRRRARDLSREGARWPAGSRQARERGPVPGAAGPHLLARVRRARRGGRCGSTGW